MSNRKSYKVVTISKSGDYVKMPSSKVIAVNGRLNSAMKVASRDFQRKQKVSADKAAEIVLNA